MSVAAGSQKGFPFASAIFYVRHVEASVMTSRVLLALDLREPTKPSVQLALVLGREMLCGDCASLIKGGGVGAADVSMGGGGEGLLWACGRRTGLLYTIFSIAAICFPYENRLRRASCGLISSINRSDSESLSWVRSFSMR